MIHNTSLLSGYLLEPRLCCETRSRDMLWSYIIMAKPVYCTTHRIREKITKLYMSSM